MELSVLVGKLNDLLLCQRLVVDAERGHRTCEQLIGPRRATDGVERLVINSCGGGLQRSGSDKHAIDVELALLIRVGNGGRRKPFVGFPTAAVLCRLKQALPGRIRLQPDQRAPVVLTLERSEEVLRIRVVADVPQEVELLHHGRIDANLSLDCRDLFAGQQITRELDPGTGALPTSAQHQRVVGKLSCPGVLDQCRPKGATSRPIRHGDAISWLLGELVLGNCRRQLGSRRFWRSGDAQRRKGERSCHPERGPPPPLYVA